METRAKWESKMVKTSKDGQAGRKRCTGVVWTVKIRGGEQQRAKEGGEQDPFGSRNQRGDSSQLQVDGQSRAFRGVGVPRQLAHRSKLQRQ